MDWWTWLILIIIVLIFLGGAASGKPGKPTKPSKFARQIADEVTTQAQYNALEKKVERADEKRQEYTAYDSRTQRQEDKLDDKYQTLQKAFDIVSNKILRWQFIPNCDIDTDYLILSNAYKIFSIAEFDEALLKFGNNKEEWYGLRGDDEPDEKDSEIKFLLKFSKIINDNSFSKNEKIKKINLLTSRSKEEAESYFDFDSNSKPGDQWYAKNT